MRKSLYHVYRGLVKACFLLMIGLVAGCSTSGQPPKIAFWIPTPTATATVTATYTPTPTATATHTATPSPTVTLTATATFTFTHTPTSTQTPTYTPTPTVTQTATPSPTFTVEPPALSITSSSLTIGQGHTIAIEVEASRPVSLTGFLDDKPLYFAETDTGGWTVVGLGPWREARRYTLQVLGWEQASQQAASISATLEVEPVAYGTDYITIAPSLSDLLEPEKREDENALLRQILDGVFPEPMWEGPFIMPVDNIITSPFGRARSYNEQPATSFHAGVDVRGSVGTPVMAAARGRVALAKSLVVRGNTVVLDHGLGVYTLYAHLNSLAVRPGQMVEQGDIIGQVGATGLVTGPHLHWEVRVRGEAVNPLEWTERAFP